MRVRVKVRVRVRMWMWMWMWARARARVTARMRVGRQIACEFSKACVKLRCTIHSKWTSIPCTSCVSDESKNRAVSRAATTRSIWVRVRVRVRVRG